MSTTSRVDVPAVVSHAEWLAARKALLNEEKALTRKRDEVARHLRELPWVKVEKAYTFEGPDGPVTLDELFEGRSQLIVQHFMLGPGWGEGCVGCSFLADHVGGALPHLEHHDVSYVAVSRAPYAEIEPFKKRMGWAFRWVSSNASSFNYDYHVSFAPEDVARGKGDYNFEENELFSEEMPGFSVFFRDAKGDVYHTYSSYARGGDILLGTYNFLDLTPKGRNETGPRHNLTDWVRHHDRYESEGHVEGSGRYVAGEGEPTCCNHEGE